MLTKESKNINCNLLYINITKKKNYQQQQLSVLKLTLITKEIENINCTLIIYP